MTKMQHESQKNHQHAVTNNRYQWVEKELEHAYRVEQVLAMWEVHRRSNALGIWVSSAISAEDQ